MFKAYSQFLTEIISNLATDPNNVPLPFNQNHNKQSKLVLLRFMSSFQDNNLRKVLLYDHIS